MLKADKELLGKGTWETLTCVLMQAFIVPRRFTDRFLKTAVCFHTAGVAYREGKGALAECRVYLKSTCCSVGLDIQAPDCLARVCRHPWAFNYLDSASFPLTWEMQYVWVCLCYGWVWGSRAGTSPAPPCKCSGVRAAVCDHVLSSAAQQSSPPEAVPHAGNNALVLVLVLRHRDLAKGWETFLQVNPVNAFCSSGTQQEPGSSTFRRASLKAPKESSVQYYHHETNCFHSDMNGAPETQKSGKSICPSESSELNFEDLIKFVKHLRSCLLFQITYNFAFCASSHIA